MSDRRSDRIAGAVVLLAIVVAGAFFCDLAVLRYLSHHADAFDMGIEDQAMWSTLHGKLFGVTLERRLTTSYLGYHIEPISLIGPILYLIYPSAISLVVFKNVVVALGAIPAFWLARKHLGSAYAGIVFALVYLLFPGLEAAQLYDFHAYTLTAPFLLAAFCFLPEPHPAPEKVKFGGIPPTPPSETGSALDPGTFSALLHPHPAPNKEKLGGIPPNPLSETAPVHGQGSLTALPYSHPTPEKVKLGGNPPNPLSETAPVHDQGTFSALAHSHPAPDEAKLGGIASNPLSEMALVHDQGTPSSRPRPHPTPAKATSGDTSGTNLVHGSPIAEMARENRRYWWLLVFLLLSAATKENAPLDMLPIGAYLLFVHKRYRLGITTALTGLIWFVVATYLIVPRFNAEGQGWLWTRYGGMGGSPLSAMEYFFSHPQAILAPVPDDPNWKYLARLLAPVAGLTLFSPTALFLMIPALAVNILTAYEPMHLIETYHYSAHLVPFVLLGAVYGIGTLASLGKRLRIPRQLTIGVLATVVLATTLVYHHYRGYTPLSAEYVGYTVTDHDRLGDRLADQVTSMIPLDAPLSAQSNLYPHVDHRPNIWMFPEVDTAQVIFLDVSTLPNTTGIDEGIHDRVRAVLDSGAFGPVLADDGYLVLRRGAPRSPLPDAFYAFARTTSPRIQHPLDVLFGDRLELLGFDVIPDRDGKVNLRAYWRARAQISSDLFLPFYITDGHGHEKGATLHREPANFWYPTNRWKPGEIVQITTYNLPIGRQGQDFGIALGAQPGADAWDTAGRLRPTVLSAPAPLLTPGQGSLLEVISFHNDHDILTPVAAPLHPSIGPERVMAVPFAEGITLEGYSASVDAGRALQLTLFWRASGPTTVPYTVFAHLLGPDGKVAAQLDSPPDGGLKSTTAWIRDEVVADRLTIPLPANGARPDLTLEVGLYDPSTGRRLTATQNGQVVDHLTLDAR